MSIVFGPNHSLSSRPQLNLVMNGVAVEQVDETQYVVLPWCYIPNCLHSKLTDSNDKVLGGTSGGSSEKEGEDHLPQ